MDKSIGILCEGSLDAELLAWVDRYPAAGDAIYAKEVKWTGGGMAANASHAIARLGGRVALITYTGEDTFGEGCINQLRQAGVNVDYILRRKGKPTPIILLMVNPSIQRAGLVMGSDSSAEVRSGEIPDDFIRSYSVFYTDLFSNENSLLLAQRAKALGLTIGFDMQMTEAHANKAGLNNRIQQLFTITDFYFADMENFLTWTGENSIESGCGKLLKQYPQKTLIITKGPEGSIIAHADKFIEIPAFKMPVVDSIGAGDAYHGAFIYSHVILGWDLQSAGLFSSATAALSCLQSGARDGLPTMNEVLAFLHEKNVPINNQKID